jgi:hypothetical protein
VLEVKKKRALTRNTVPLLEFVAWLNTSMKGKE